MELTSIRAQARASLKGKWGSMALIWLFFSIVQFVLVPFSILTSGPLLLGYFTITLRILRKQDVSAGMIFGGFSDFGRSFLANLLIGIFVSLWSMLLIIPGIIAALSYSMTYYILADNPNMTASQAITASKEMMKGYKGKLFLLYLSFIGWALLCPLTVGLGYLWLWPYITTTFFRTLNLVASSLGYLWLWPYITTSHAAFYENIKGATPAVEAEEE